MPCYGAFGSDRNAQRAILLSRPLITYASWSIPVPKKVVKYQTAPGPSACGDGLLRPFPDAAVFLGIGRSKMFALMADGTIPTGLREELRVRYAASGESDGVVGSEPHRLRQWER
jgi:hypothetical protein